jgi:DNA-binding NarL/FixJ family response regulator
VIDEATAQCDAVRARLTPRQREIADLMAQGRLFRDIAHELGVSEGYVKICMSAAYKRIGVKNGRELMALFGVGQ